jgi:hypothetical protein
MSSRRSAGRSLEEQAAGALIGELRIILGELRTMFGEMKVLVAANSKAAEHSLAGIKQIAAIERSIIAVFKPLQETVALHGKEIVSIKAELKALRLAVDALEHPETTGEAPL